jgi:hypothetical protein
MSSATCNETLLNHWDETFHPISLSLQISGPTPQLESASHNTELYSSYQFPNFNRSTNQKHKNLPQCPWPPRTYHFHWLVHCEKYIFNRASPFMTENLESRTSSNGGVIYGAWQVTFQPPLNNNLLHVASLMGKRVPRARLRVPRMIILIQSNCYG